MLVSTRSNSFDDRPLPCDDSSIVAENDLVRLEAMIRGDQVDIEAGGPGVGSGRCHQIIANASRHCYRAVYHVDILTDGLVLKHWSFTVVVMLSDRGILFVSVRTRFEWIDRYWTCLRFSGNGQQISKTLKPRKHEHDTTVTKLSNGQFAA